MQSQQIDLARNAGLSESLLGRQQGAWNDFQGRQMQGLALAPQTQQMGFFDAQQLAGIGGAQQEMNQSQLSQAYQNFLEQRDWGANRLGLLGSALGTINGGFQNGAVTSPNLNRPNPWVGAAGGAATGAGMGMAAGPVGAGVGALIGAGLGYFGSR